MKEITKEEYKVGIINSIKDKYPQLRQKSKTVTFAAQYGGTYHTFMNSGFNEEEAKSIEANYHELYKESDAYKAKRLEECSKQGYTDVAFGLRVRTPLLSQVIWGSDHIPYAAHEESRTVGNAMGQSYGLLNNRAMNNFMLKVWNSEYATDILPIAAIHDASYYLVKKDPEVVHFLNTYLIEEYNRVDLPEIEHDKVGLGGEVDIFYPSWANPITIKKDCSLAEIEDILNSLS